MEEGIKGNVFKKIIIFLPNVKQVSEWHFRITGTDGTRWNLFFNLNGRMKFAAERSSQSYEGISPERVIRFIGWDESTVNEAIKLSGAQITTDVRYEEHNQ
ncbi:MAG: hypothetical protein U0798_15305 [Gemmataceae bacterium]